MPAVSIEILRIVEAAYPGFVECRLIDAHGREWMFVEKLPIVTAEDLGPDSNYPRSGVIACEIVEKTRTDDGMEIVIIDTGRPWGIEATTGESRFAIHLEQLSISE